MLLLEAVDLPVQVGGSAMTVGRHQFAQAQGNFALRTLVQGQINAYRAVVAGLDQLPGQRHAHQVMGC